MASREPTGDGVDRPGAPWRPVLAAFLSALVTGGGQFYARRWWRGLVLLAPVVLVGLGAVALRDRGFTYFLELLVQPRVLWAILLINIALLGIRGFAVVDAYRLRGGATAPSWTRALVALMVVAVAAPHFVAITYSLDAISVIETVFAPDELPPIAEREAALLAAGVAEEELGPVLVMSATFEPRGPLTQEEAFGLIPDSDLNPFRPVIIPPEPEFQDAPFVPLEERSGLDRITVLLAGGDAGPGRGGLRTDTMMVATMDLNTGKAAIFSLARNLSRVPLPRGFQNAFREMQISFARKAYDRNPPPPTTVTTSPPVEGEPPAEPQPPQRPPFRAPAPCKCFVNQLNALYPFTRNWVRTFPNEVDPGMAALRETLENLLKLRIDYYVLVDMAGFVDLVDAIGGVDVYVEKPMHIAFSAPVEGGEKALINVAVGENHLDGLEALAYVRSRYRSSDYTRMRRQRCMLRSLAAEATPGKLVTSFSAVAAAIRNSATTDIPISFVPDLVTYASRLDLDDIETVAFQPSYYAPTNDFLGHPVPNVKRIRAKVKSVLANVKDPAASVIPDDAECTPRIEGG